MAPRADGWHGPGSRAAALDVAMERARRERAEAELESARQDLEIFAYSVAHDLRNPLQAVAGFTELLLDQDHLGSEARELLERVATAGARMQGVIDQMLAFATPRRELERRVVDLTALAREIASELQRGCTERDVEWMIEEGVASACDPALIREVLARLLENAWKYTSPIEAARIEFGVTERRGARSLFVRDNGIGFEAPAGGDLPVARFDLTARLDGTGLGLPTVRRILARHGGSIEATSCPETGTTFYFTLGSPIARAEGTGPRA